MAEEKWEEAVKESDLEEGVPVSVKLEKKNVLLVKVGGKVHACGAKCTHYGAPLKEGILSGHELTCPWHNARFDVTTGNVTSPPALDDLVRYDTKKEKGKIHVRKAEKAPAQKDLSRMPGRKEETFVVVGAGAAGTSATLALRRLGFTGRLVMVTAESELPYDRPNLSKDFLTGEVKREWMWLKPPDHYKSLAIEVLTNHKVVNVDPDKKTIAFAHESTLRYDKILLATGGIPRSPDIPGVDHPGFFLLRSFSDAEAVLKALEGAREAVVIGASFIGLEVAAALRSRNLNVHVVSPETVPMARVFGERIGSYIRRLHEEHGVLFHLGGNVKGITATGKGRAVKLSDGSLLPADIVVAGIGVVPAVTYLMDSGLVENGAVPVDARFRTPKEGIFAAGDIAVVPDPRTGKGRRIEHWVEAERQGQHAALSMLGSEEPYGEVPFFWTKQYDAELKYVGHAKTYDRIAYRGAVEEGTFLAGFYQDGELLAAAGSGRASDIIVLGRILRAGVRVSPGQIEDDKTDLKSLLP